MEGGKILLDNTVRNYLLKDKRFGMRYNAGENNGH